MIRGVRDGISKAGKRRDKVSEIALGAWLTVGGSIDEPTTRACVKAALDNGVNFFDKADIYAKGEAERVMGKVIRDLGLDMSQLGLAWLLRRSEISAVITGATKPEHVLSTAEGTGVNLTSDVLERIEQILDNAP